MSGAVVLTKICTTEKHVSDDTLTECVLNDAAHTAVNRQLPWDPFNVSLLITSNV